MSDLYGSYESEDMSSFLQIILQNSLSSAATSDKTASVAAGTLFSGGMAAGVAEPSTSINFSDVCFLSRDSDENNLSSCERFEGCDAPMNNNHLPQRSSKRSRAAEIHNMSEKRRRSRINEKIKALQNLIPNSNKTDKASMLDDAIEYLKQLQLRVQMLTMRNGLNLHPGYSQGAIQSMSVASAGLGVFEGNTSLNASRGTETLSKENHLLPQTGIEPTNPSSSIPCALIPSMANNVESGFTPPNFVTSAQHHYGLLTHLSSTKDIHRDDALSRLQLDMSSGNTSSSPGVSS